MGGRNGKEEPRPYIQATLVGGESGADAEPAQETELENCLVLSRPLYKPATKKQAEQWAVRVHAQPTMFQPETDTLFLATAESAQAVAFNKEKLRPGDRAHIRGVPGPTVVSLRNGSEIRSISVTALHVLSRTQRVSTTVFEQQRQQKGG